MWNVPCDRFYSLFHRNAQNETPTFDANNIYSKRQTFKSSEMVHDRKITVLFAFPMNWLFCVPFLLDE